MNNQALPPNSRVRVVCYSPFRGLKGTIRKVDTIAGLEADEAFCFYLVELEGTHNKEPIWFEYDEVELVGSNLVAHPVGGSYGKEDRT
jgi:hypothetical protein